MKPSGLGLNRVDNRKRLRRRQRRRRNGFYRLAIFRASFCFPHMYGCYSIGVKSGDDLAHFFPSWMALSFLVGGPGGNDLNLQGGLIFSILFRLKFAADWRDCCIERVSNGKNERKLSLYFRICVVWSQMMVGSRN